MKCPDCHNNLKRRKICVLAGGRSNWVKRKYCEKCDIYWYKSLGGLYKG